MLSSIRKGTDNMKYQIVRPTNWNQKKRCFNLKVYPLIGGVSAHKLAKSESIKFKTKVYMKNAKTRKLMYIYNQGVRHDYTKGIWA